MSLLTTLLSSAGGGNASTGGGNASTSYDGEVSIYSSLPTATDNNGKVYLVETDEGDDQAGLYRSNGTIWSLIGQDYDSLDDIGEGINNKHLTSILKTNYDAAYTHTGNTSNPHSVTPSQLGLENLDNTSDTNKPISTATQTALNGKVDDSQVLTDVPENAVFTDTTYSVGDGGLTQKNFTNSLKTKLDGIEVGATNTSDPLQSFSQNASQYIGTDEIRARDSDGLKLNDDGSDGILIKNSGDLTGSYIAINKTTSLDMPLSVCSNHNQTDGTGYGYDKAIFSVTYNSYPNYGTSYGEYGLYMGSHHSHGNGWIQTGRSNASSSNGDQFNLILQPNSGNVGIGITSNIVGSKLTINGSISKTSGSFDIPHPDPKKIKEDDSYRLRHYFIETPSAGGNIYKYQLELKKGVNSFPLPDYFSHLNKDTLVWVSPFKHLGRAWGEVKGGECEVTVEKTGMYNVLLFGDRKDEIAIKEFDKFGIEYKSKKGEVTKCL